MIVNIKNKIVNLRVNFIRRFFPNYIISKSRKAIEENNNKIAYKMLSQTYIYHPYNYKINLMLKNLTLINEDWDKAITHLKFLINDYPTIENYINMVNCYNKLGLNEEHNKFVNKIISIYPNEILLMLGYISQLLNDKKWDLVYNSYLKIIKENIELPMDHLLNLVMIAQIHGDYDYADSIMNKYTQIKKELKNSDEIEYKKLIIFDNGESRIEFYKKMKPVDQVVVTFDSINMEWHEPPFSYQYLKRKDVDIIAVRKRKTKTYQQDLSQEDFIKSTEVIVNKYKDKVAYGYSLGAYNTLYYASLINCRIYSLAPRLSIHPVYGRSHIIPKHRFEDNESLPYNDMISPIVVYDPKNKIDKRYIQNEVLTQLPKSIIIEIKYGGHAMAHHLLRTEQLKYFVDSLLNGDTPKYDKKMRVNSNIYFRRLADECYKHNKNKWALDLINKSLNLFPDEILASQIKVKILLAKDRIEEALAFIRNLIKKNPELLRYRVLLIETYMTIDDLNQAYKEWMDATEEFGTRPSLENLQNLLAVDETEV